VSAAAGDLRGELARRDEQIAALGRVAHRLADVEEAQGIMEVVADEGGRLFGAARAGVFLFDEPGVPVRCAVARGLSPAYLEAVRLGFSQLPTAAALLRAEPCFVRDARQLAGSPIREEARREGIAGLAALPLVTGGRAFGALVLYHAEPRDYSEAERGLALAFAGEAALAISKSRLIETVIRIKTEWQSAFDGTGNGLALVDPGGRVERANRFLADLAGVGVTALPGLELGSLFAGWPAGGRDPLSEARRRGTRWSAMLDARNGRHMVVTATPRADGGYVVAVDDLTAYVRLEARYSRVLETATEAIVLADAAGQVTFANPAAASLFGKPPEALVGEQLERLFPAEEGQDFPAGPRRYESLIRRPAGVRIAEVSSVPLEELATVVGRMAVARDVTAERLATEGLRRSERRHRTLFYRAPLAIVTLDRDGGFLGTNGAALRMVGLSRPARGVRLADLVIAEDQARVMDEVNRSFGGETREFVFRFRRADGAVRQGFAVSVPVEERAGHRAVLAIGRDVTDEVALRERLSHSEKMAALGALVSGVAHELNNPLAGIAALAQATAGSLNDAETEEALGSIQREAVRAARIVQRLLGFARLQPLALVPTDLNEVIRDVLATTPALTGDQIRWARALAQSLPGVPADPDQIRQVVTNLLVNAAHAMREAPRREGEVRTWYDDDWVGCEVEDSGPGIAPEILPRIFEPFFTTKPMGSGTGLGLSISRGIVRAHGGELEGANRLEGGARFSFRLPRDLARAGRTSHA
jgi:PAS domain S-box-containing protein